MSMQIEPRDESWQTVKVWAEREIEDLRGRLERPSLDWEKTIGLRAEIKRLRALLGLPEAIRNGDRTIERPDD